VKPSVRPDKLEAGQSLVELAIGFVVLLFILSGLIDLGRAYFTFVALEDGAGEAALYLSINPECRYASDGAACADPNNAEFRAKNAGSGHVDWSSATITIERPAIGVGEPVSVTIAYPFELITPVIPRIASASWLTLYGSANQVIIRE
jgi:Flp pilus assembly protein TadG